MIVAIVPFKGDDRAKSRLSAALPVERRLAVTHAVLGHVLGILSQSRELDAIGVVSPRPVAGFRTIDDPGQGLNAAVRAGMKWALTAGADTLIVVPADLPLITTESVRALVNAIPRRGGVVAPSKDGGTGALALRPPDAIAPAFGPNSAESHLQRLQDAGMQSIVLDRSELAFDLDRPEDLAWMVHGVNQGTGP